MLGSDFYVSCVVGLAYDMVSKGRVVTMSLLTLNTIKMCVPIVHGDH